MCTSLVLRKILIIQGNAETLGANFRLIIIDLRLAVPTETFFFNFNLTRRKLLIRSHICNFLQEQYTKLHFVKKHFSFQCCFKKQHSLLERRDTTSVVHEWGRNFITMKM